MLSTGVVARAQTPGRYYTVDQAHTGAELFATYCSACHGGQLQGVALKGPALVGAPIRARRWTMNLLFSFVSHQMPANARGSLSSREYSALMAFLLQRNGHPAGAIALRPELIRRVFDRF